MFEVITFDLTSRCNLRCVHCFREKTCSHRDLPFALIERVLGQIHPIKPKAISFTGGEPTLHPDFGAIIDLAVRRGYSFSLVTNGVNFEHVAQVLVENLCKIRSVSFSLDGVREEVNRLHRGDSSYSEVMAGVDICSEAGIPFSLQMTVTSKNLCDVEDYAILAAKLGAQQVLYIPAQPTPRGVRGGFCLEPEELWQLATQIRVLRNIYKIPITPCAGFPNKSPFFQCDTMKMRQVHVNCTGALTFCCQLSEYVGGHPGTDIIADLSTASLATALDDLITSVTEFYCTKISQVSSGTFGKTDYFPCWYCAKHFKKLDWLADIEDNSWAASLVRPSVARGDT